MHIHLPKGNLESLRGFLLELFTITCGILIAISLESAVVSIHHHYLLREARGNILSEMRDNHRIIDSTAKEIPSELGMLQNVVALCLQERAHRGSVDLRKVKRINLGFTGFAISSDNWSTALCHSILFDPVKYRLTPTLSNRHLKMQNHYVPIQSNQDLLFRIRPNHC